MKQTVQQIAAIVTRKLKETDPPDDSEFQDLWDKYSQHVDDNLDSFQQVAGQSLITRTDFFKLINEFRKGNTDAKQIASKQEYEVNFISYHYKIPKNVILAVIKEVQTTSRKRVYAVLREMGYIIETSNRKK